MKQNGVTMIEALIASTIIGFSMLGYMQYKKMEIEDNLVKEFEYDFKKVIQGFENKLMNDKLLDKKYWASNKFENNLNNHLIANLTDISEGCDNLSKLDLNGKNYISCISPIRMKIFDVNTNGRIRYYDNDEFKSHSFNFTPKDTRRMKKIKLLSKAIKRVFADQSLYTNVDFFIKNKRATYLNCLKRSDDCYLRVTFGTNIDYLDEENTIETEINNGYSDEINILNRSDDYLNKNNNDEDYYDDQEYDVRDDRDDDQILKDQLKSKGVELSNKEFKKVKNELDKIKKDPILMERMKKQLERTCSKYDEDDYYFMSLYDKNNVCYKHYGE